MKKIVILLILLFFIGFYIKKEDYKISEDSIRFRVVSNSNSMNDVLMKEKVVNELSGILFKEVKSNDEMKKIIYSNLENIEIKIDTLFKKYNYNKSFKVSYGLNRIPKKVYRSKVLEEGIYNSLIIEIGEAKGDNYFCILYPSLCLIDYSEKNEDKYNFKIIELIKRINL